MTLIYLWIRKVPVWASLQACLIEQEQILTQSTRSTLSAFIGTSQARGVTLLAYTCEIVEEIPTCAIRYTGATLKLVKSRSVVTACAVKL